MNSAKQNDGRKEAATDAEESSGPTLTEVTDEVGLVETSSAAFPTAKLLASVCPRMPRFGAIDLGDKDDPEKVESPTQTMHSLLHVHLEISCEAKTDLRTSMQCDRGPGWTRKSSNEVIEMEDVQELLEFEPLAHESSEDPNQKETDL